MSVEFVLVRIDDRLIHGQVVIGWAKVVSPNVLVVANDTVAQDPLQKSLLEMSATPAFEVKICSVNEIATWSSQKKLEGKRVLLLFSNPQDVLRAVEAGLKLTRINVGGMRYCPGKKQIKKAIAIGEEDIQSFKLLRGRGIEISIQMVPTDEPMSIEKYF